MPTAGRRGCSEATRGPTRCACTGRSRTCPGDVTLWPNLTGGEAIDILCRLSGPLDPRRKQLMLDRFDLDPTKKARAYSKGNRQKVALVAALASRADLLLLDEPTSGLDPLMEAAFTESIREVKAEGRSVLLSSHIFAEVERLADQVTIIREGVTVESGTIAELRHLTRSQLTVGLDHGADGLAALPGVHDLQQLDGHVTFAVDDAELASVLAAVAALTPRSLVANPPSLEELFLRHYGTELAALNGTEPMTTATQPPRADRHPRSSAPGVATRWSGPARWSGWSCGATGSAWRSGWSRSWACSRTSRSTTWTSSTPRRRSTTSPP